MADSEVGALLGDLHRAEAMLRAAVVSAVGEIETRELHLKDGHRSIATYLAHHHRLRRPSAAATAQLAHKRWLLPNTVAALQTGQISEAHAQIIGRAWTLKLAKDFARDEALLVEKALELSFEQFYFFIEHWKNIADPDRGKANAERAVRERRAYCSHVGDRVHTNAVSDAISGTILIAAIDRVAQELFAQDWAETKAEHGADATPALMPRSSAQRRHDALILLVERGSAAHPDAKRPEPLVNIVCDYETFQQAVAELAGEQADYQLDSTCALLDGTPITPQQALEQALHGFVARIVMGADDIIINAGRTRRFFTPRMKAILAVRDRHCTWPGCDAPPSRCEADHIIEYQHGGRTDINNGRNACPYHHRQYRKPARGL